MRELLKDWRKLVRLNRRRTPGGLCCDGDDCIFASEVGDVGETGECGTSPLSLVVLEVSVECLRWLRSNSLGGLGGKAPGIFIVAFGNESLVGCDVNGPPPGVKGRD